MNTSTSRILTENDLARFAPAIFTEYAAPTVSEKYQFVSTHDVLQGLQREGWYPVKATQSNSRKENGKLFAKHMIRMRHADYDKVQAVGDVVPEVVLFNSHDRGSTFQISSGLFRLVCSNGMVVADSTIANARIRHSGDAIGNVIEGCFEVIKETPKVLEHVAAFQAIETRPEERQAFAHAASLLRWEDEKAPVTSDRLLSPRRYGDKGTDFWTVFNVVQENMLKGGQRGGFKNGRRQSSREVKAPVQEIGLNKALWELAQAFAALKAA